MDKRGCGPIVDSICLQRVPLEKLPKGAKIRTNDRELRHREGKFTLTHTNTYAYQVGVHSGCHHNQLVSLHNRHLRLPNTGFDPKFMKQYLTHGPVTRLTKMKPLQFAKCYSGSKRRKYIEAAFNLHDWSPQVKMFVKAEKAPLDKIYEKAPRAIQFRGREYNILLGMHLKPVEEYYYSDYWREMGELTPIAKQLNLREKAQNLRAKWKMFHNPMALLLDHSKFDSSINVAHLKFEHQYYLKFFPQLKNLLRQQLNNKGRTDYLTYQVKGTRMSGDYNTALGNTYLNHRLLLGFLKYCGIRGEMLLDGDDSVVIIEQCDFPRIKMDYFDKMGFVTKCEYATQFEKIEFCQARPVKTVTGWVLARNPQRFLSHNQLSKEMKAVDRWLAGVGIGDLATGSGLPIQQEVAWKMAWLSNRPLYTEQVLRRLEQGYSMNRERITAECRQSYYEAWGVEPELQGGGR